MATYIRPLRSGSDTILPRTVAKAVTLEDGSTLEYALENRDTEDVKVSAELAAILDVPLGTTLTEVLLNMVANGATVLDATIE